MSLFVSRARDVRSLAVDDDDTIAVIAQICRRLDGIPLAIELAAARTQSLSVAEIARHLDDRFKLLTRGARTALGRHQTLRAAIDWSFDLLDAAEQRVLTPRPVFAGGFTLDAAAAVCDPETRNPLETLDHVDGLVRRSLLDRGRRRQQLPDTGCSRPSGSTPKSDSTTNGDADEASRAHLDWCAALVVEAGEGLRRRDDAVWVARLEREVDNIRAALNVAVSNGDLDCRADAPGIGATRRSLGQPTGRIDGDARERSCPGIG